MRLEIERKWHDVVLCACYVVVLLNQVKLADGTRVGHVVAVCIA